MDRRSLTGLFLFLAVVGSWQGMQERRRDPHYHSKRHMLPRDTRRTSPGREMRKKPPGYLTPLQEEEMDDDEVVSVSVGPLPQPITAVGQRPRYNIEKFLKATKIENNKTENTSKAKAVTFVKDVIVEIAKDLLTHEVSEEFIFGQYIGKAMKKVKEEYKTKMQLEILDLIKHYQHKNETRKPEEITTVKPKTKSNETDEVWTDFTNLENIVG